MPSRIQRVSSEKEEITLELSLSQKRKDLKSQIIELRQQGKDNTEEYRELMNLFMESMGMK